MGKPLELHFVDGPLSGQRVTVPPAGLRFGRSSSNDLHCGDGELSRTHCMFEQGADGSLKVTDLASANGTFVNGHQLGADPFAVKHGDMIEAGSSHIKVVDPSAPAAPVRKTPAKVMIGSAALIDLGLAKAGASGAAAGGEQPKKRSALINVLWAVAIISIVAAMGVILFMPQDDPSIQPSAAVVSVEQECPPVTSLLYEKVDANATRIFRFQMTIDASGVLRVVYDDIPGENRHVDKSTKLSPVARKRIAEIFASSGWRSLDNEYTGYSTEDENSLKSKRVRVTVGKTVKDVRTENTTEPEEFLAVVSALEAFSRNELGIWALQYTRDQLISLSADSERLGDTKWGDREVEYANLSEGIKAYKEAVFYLETVNPKPDGYSSLKDKLSRAEAELDRRYKDQCFRADKAINLGNWEVARLELRTLCDLVPDSSDQRHIDAKAKLVDVEDRLSKAKNGGSK